MARYSTVNTCHVLRHVLISEEVNSHMKHGMVDTVMRRNTFERDSMSNNKGGNLYSNGGIPTYSRHTISASLIFVYCKSIHSIFQLYLVKYLPYQTFLK
jgi:hypothetical protein